MRSQTSITIRLDPADIRAIDAIVAREGGSRGRQVKQAVELLISEESRHRLLRDAVNEAAAEALTALRQEATLLMRGQAEAARASDALSCQRMAEFIEVIGAEAPIAADKPAKPAKRLTDLARADA